MKDQLENLIATLAHARLRPGMYFSSDLPALLNFMSGFSIACAILGVDTGEEETEIWKERGWKLSSHHPVMILKEQGLSDDEINAEVFAVLILAFQRKYDISNEPVLKVHSFIRDKIAKAQTNESVVNKTHSHVPHTLRAMDSLEKEMDNR